jgi:mono/diheme cytochrome c family protein
MKLRTIALIIILSLHVMIAMALEKNDGEWLTNVPHNEHVQKSPIHAKAGTVAQGRNTFQAHCAQCHGADAKGTDRAPALNSTRIKHQTTDGDLHWLLVNGYRDRGMPAWGKLGEFHLWQVITYLRSLR